MIYTVGIIDIFSNYRDISIEECISYFKDKKFISIDCETTGGDPHSSKIISLQLGDKSTQFFIDCRVVNILRFKDLLENNKLILQNAKFDYKMLKAAGIVIENIYDTMIAECVLYCGYNSWGYGLKKLIKQYCGVEISKEERVGFISQGSKPFSASQIEYGCTDVRYLEDIKKKQEEKIVELDLVYCVNLEMKVIKTLGDIEYNGMLLDKEAWLKNTEEYKKKLEITKQELDDIVINEPKLSKYVPKFIQGNLFGSVERRIRVNYDSPSQVLQIFKSLGFDTSGTGERELSRLVRIEEEKGVYNIMWTKHDFFTKLWFYRKYAKIDSTYGESFLNYINPKTSRVHTSFWQLASTGRVTSGNKNENAPNLQNIPASNSFRNAFVAREGFNIISADYSGQELCLMADRANEPLFIEAINNNEDLHSKSATLLYNKPITKKDKVERNASKTVTFGLCYGMGANKLADSLFISVNEAEDLLAKYRKTFPTLMGWLDKSGQRAKLAGKGITQDICKRIRWFPDMEKSRSLRLEKIKDWKTILTIEGSTEREGKNFLIQGSAANMTKEALVEVRKLVQEYGEAAYLICTVHDQIDVEVNKEVAEEFAEKMEKIMITVGNKYLDRVRIKADITNTPVWSK